MEHAKKAIALLSYLALAIHFFVKWNKYSAIKCDPTVRPWSPRVGPLGDVGLIPLGRNVDAGMHLLTFWPNVVMALIIFGLTCDRDWGRMLILPAYYVGSVLTYIIAAPVYQTIVREKELKEQARNCESE